MSRLSLILLFALIAYALNTLPKTYVDDRACIKLNVNVEETLKTEYEEEYCASLKTTVNYTHCCMFEDTNGIIGCGGITDDEYENIVRYKKYLRDQYDDEDIGIDCSSRFISISLLAVLALLF